MRILLWDFDGTLARREGGWTGTLVAVAQRLVPDRGVTRDAIRPFLQAGFPWHTPDRPHPDQTPKPGSVQGTAPPVPQRQHRLDDR